MTDADILRQARKVIEDDRSQYICLALHMVANRPRMKIWRQVIDLRTWVLYMLRWKDTYEDWFRATQGKKKLTPYKAKQARLAWIDWMIAYCEERGL